LAALNGLEVKASYIQNANLCTPCEEKVYNIIGPEFDEHEGKKVLIVRALYGLKSAGASFSRHLTDGMRYMGYIPPSDHRTASDTTPMFLLYVGDVLCTAHNTVDQIKKLDKLFTMKPGSIGDPDTYLDTKLKKVMLDNGVSCWGMSPSKYIRESINNVEAYLRDKSLPKLKTKSKGTSIIRESNTTTAGQKVKS
jgi:hypothetical protein